MIAQRHAPTRLAVGVLVCTAALAAAGVVAEPASAGSVSYTTPGTYSFQVPANVTEITLAAAGGGGGAGKLSQCLNYPGKGGSEQGTFPVTPGAQLAIVVAGKGGDASDGQGGVGGIGGGGSGGTVSGGTTNAGGGGGGGASSITTGGSVLLVAAGGGGCGGFESSFAADDGAPGASGGYAGGGGAGTQSSGGAGGASQSSLDPAGMAGSLAQGGNGAGNASQNGGGGGGGGGYYGGGGGGGVRPGQANAGGGGGGSDYTAPTGTSTSSSPGSNEGDGQVSITYKATVSVTAQASGSVTTGHQVTDTATLSGGAAPTGTITFALYGPDDATCSGTPASTSTKTVNSTGDYTSDAAAPSAAGTYRWTAAYSGDANNHPAATACNDSGESVVVTGSPTATTNAASSVTMTGASLNGSVNPHDSQTSYHFDYGLSTSYGSQTPASDVNIGSDNIVHSASQTLTGLTPGTTYHFRIVATNAVSTSDGADQTLTTPAEGAGSSDGGIPPAGTGSSGSTTVGSTSGTGPTTHRAGTGKPSIGNAKTSGSTVAVAVKCAPGGPSCVVRLRITITETLIGRRVIAISSRKTTKTTRKLVLLGGTEVTLGSAQSKIVRVSLNATGRRLLANHPSLRAKLTAGQPGAGAAHNISVQTIAFKTPAKKHRG
jgi:hypothetical protein